MQTPSLPLMGEFMVDDFVESILRQPKKFNIRFLGYGKYLSILWCGGSSVCLYWVEKWRVFQFHSRWTQKLVLEQCNEPLFTVVHIGPCDELASWPRVYPALAHMQLGWDPAPSPWPPKRIKSRKLNECLKFVNVGIYGKNNIILGFVDVSVKHQPGLPASHREQRFSFADHITTILFYQTI